MKTLLVTPMNVLDDFTGEVVKEQILCEWEGQTLVIPKSEANRHYAAILKAVGNGELTIAPAES